MRFQGAVVREQGVTFAIVVVKRHIVANRSQAQQAINSFQPAFPGLPVILMAQDGRGQPTYFGRKDIARFLSHIPMQAIPWREYTVH
ncbi:MAG: hypothetical protein MI741_03670 [Rhodospirillales bacterium]|nr:hypothetical protein [Rhodospirillales bacterium]